MAVIEKWFAQDLQKPVVVHHLDGSLFSHNGNGNRIGVELYNGGEPLESITGTVSGYVVVSDGTTVPCTGAKSGNRASILIPAAAYVPGNVFVSIFVTDDTTVTTVAAMQSTVLQTRTGTQVDPGSVVSDWTDTINAAMQEVETAAEDLAGIIATPYASLTYPVPLGKYTYYNGGLYRCISPIASSESWTAAHWTSVKLGDDVSNLKSAIEYYDSEIIETQNPNMVNSEQLLKATDWAVNDGVYYGPTKGIQKLNYSNGGFDVTGGFKENTQYTMSLLAYVTGTSASNDGVRISATYTDNSYEVIIAIKNNTASWKRFTGTTASGKTVKSISATYYSKPDNITYIKEVMFNEGSYRNYEPYGLSAKDKVHREIADQFTESGLNLADESKIPLNGAWQYDGESYYGEISKLNSRYNAFRDVVYKADTRYTISFDTKCAEAYGTDNGLNIVIKYIEDESSTTVYRVRRDTTNYRHCTFTTDADKTVQYISMSYSAGASDIWYIKNLQIVEGTIDKPFETYGKSAVDKKVRRSMLYPTGDTVDRSGDIMRMLTAYGICELAAGNYYVNGVTMPAGSKITGCGDATKIYLAESGVNAIVMGDRCTVCDVTLYGATEDITIDGDFAGIPTENVEATNYWDSGSCEIPSSSGFLHMLLTTPIQPGTYRISADIATDAPTSTSYIGFSTSQTTSIAGTSIIAEALISNASRGSATVEITSTVYSVRVCSASSLSASEGYSATWSNIRITKVGGRSGIKWAGSVVQFGTITNCRLARFNCAGILAMDTSTPVDHNLAISNCFITNCNAGIYIRRDSEFNKITNCTLTRNWYGYLNRGGNNDLSNSGVDANKVNCQIDNDEGSNGGHGTITGCSFNHANDNTGYGLIIRGTGRMLVTNCNLYFGKTLLDNTDGNVISGCGYGRSAGIEISGGNTSIFSNCMLRGTGSENSPITITNNNYAQFVNCYTRYSATPVNPRA